MHDQEKSGAEKDLPEIPSPEGEMTDLPPDEMLAALEQKAARAEDSMLRLSAEMENLRRRTRREVENAQKYALEKFINELLPIVDGLEMALIAHSGENAASGTLLDGVRMTLNMMLTAFERFGVQQVNPLGQSFDPAQHHAVKTCPDGEVAPGTVVEVFQKGYVLNDRLVRPALVVVSG